MPTLLAPFGLAQPFIGVETGLDRSLEAGIVAYLLANPIVDELVANKHVYPYFVPREVEQGEFPCVVYKLTEQSVPGITGQTGLATVSLDLECWSTNIDDSGKLANAVRKACQGFRGYWGLCPIAGSWYQGFDDDAEKPGDDSGTYWFCRTVTFTVAYAVPLHTF